MKKLYVVLLLVLPAISVFSQNYPGYNTGNFTGVNSVFFNPANIADNPYKWDVNLISVNATIVNDYATVDTKNLFKSFNSDSLDKIINRKNGTNANLSLDFDAFGPSFMFNLDKQSSIAITTRARFMLNGDKIPNNLLNTIENKGSNITFPSNANSKRFDITLNGWEEYGITYARVISDQKTNYFKGGITLKYLAGAGSGYFVTTNFNGTLDKDILDNTILKAATGQLLFGYSGSTKFNDVAKFKFNGSGIGADLGFVYEYRPDIKSDEFAGRYKLKAELAIHDIGSISYDHSTDDGTYDLNTALNPRPFPLGSDTMQLARFSGVTTDFNTLRDAVKEADPMLKKTSNATNKYKMALPTSLTGAVDFNLYSSFYLNLGGMISLNKGASKAEKTHTVNYITFTPRYEKKAYGFYLPLSYNDISGFNAGISMRGGPFFAGSGSILSTVLSGKTSQADFHFGLHVGILKKKKEPKAPKIVAAKEEPVLDKDGDGVPDNVDKCPTIAGLIKYNGCPIPDSDSDGVNDEEDKCPTVAGLAKYNGCPAPDTDKDGINDEEDKCPTEPGLARYQGCPIPDTDKDGVNDEEDKCPAIPGVARYQGCPIPDTDKDSVNDEEDKCPTIPGPVSNHGCPVIKKEIIQKVNFAAKNLLFQTGKAIILKRSYAQLDNVVKILKADSSLNIEIDGHTDNSGDSTKNMKLSADRANSAKAYFVKKGIAEKRIITEGFGPTKPIATNKTAQGRAKNRRVEFVLRNY